MIMEQFIELTKDFKTSQPLFKIEISNYGNVKAKCVEKYKPDPIPGNYLSELVCANYSESFNVHDGFYSLNAHEIVQRSMADIRRDIPRFIEKNIGMRNPRQSKLYRWAYRNMPDTTDFNSVLIMMYKYIRSFSDSDMKSNNTDQINNTIALLEAVMEKYGE